MSTANSESIFEGGHYCRGLSIRRYRNARGLRLKVDSRNADIMLSMPWRGSERYARRWAETQRDWIEAQLAALPPPHPIADGATVPFRGEDAIIEWMADYPRKPRLEEGRLQLGGEPAEISNRILRWMKAKARPALSKETQHFAELAGVEVPRIGIGDPRSRWGSCSSGGAIRYSWRLIMAPPRILSATAAHEVAHRVHMNHGPQFHALVRELFGGDPAPERQWLRQHGAALHRVGSSS